jgi:spoIIIJ-associated protein
METLLQETIEDILNRISSPFRKIKIDKRDDTYRINIESEEPSLLIGHHGENIFALQNLLKIIIWKKQPGEYKILLDIDDYRKRQEENVIRLAERKADQVIKTQQPQSLPAMSPYFRRVVHLHLAEKFTDLMTESVGEGDFRHIMIKPKA